MSSFPLIDVYGLDGAGPDATVDFGDRIYDAENQHPYPKSGDQPRAWIKGTLDEILILAQDTVQGSPAEPEGFPVYLTKAGYHTAVNQPDDGDENDGSWEGVIGEVQATLILNMVFDAVDLGVERLFLYDLYNDDNPADDQQSRNFGLFEHGTDPLTGAFADTVAKPAATALNRLTDLLRVGGAEDADFDPAPVAYTVHQQLDATGARVPADTVAEADRVRDLAVATTDGNAFVVLWHEQDIWDEANNVAYTPEQLVDQWATLDLNGTRYQEIKVRGLVTGEVTTYRDATRVDVVLEGGAKVVELGAVSQDEPVCLAEVGAATDATARIEVRLAENEHLGHARVQVTLEDRTLGTITPPERRIVQADHQDGGWQTLVVNHDLVARNEYRLRLAFHNDVYDWVQSLVAADTGFDRDLIVGDVAIERGLIDCILNSVVTEVDGKADDIGNGRFNLDFVF